MTDGPITERGDPRDRMVDALEMVVRGRGSPVPGRLLISPSELHTLLDAARRAVAAEAALADANQRADDYADTLRAMLDALPQSYDFYQRLARAALDRLDNPDGEQT